MIAAVVALVFIGAWVGGYFYFQSELAKLESDKSELQTQLTVAQAQSAEQTKNLQAITDAETIEKENVATFKSLREIMKSLNVPAAKISATNSGTLISASGATTPTSTGSLSWTGEWDTASGSLVQTWETPIDQVKQSDLAMFYTPDATIEGPISGDSFAAYEKKLAVALKLENDKNEIVGYPVEISQGEWTAVVTLKDVYTEIPVKIELSATGSLIPSAGPARTAKTQEMYMTLARWQEGVITEEYVFEYPSAISQSKLPAYIK